MKRNVLLSILLLIYFSLLISQKEGINEKTDNQLMKKAIVEKQKQLTEMFAKFTEKLERVAQKLKTQSVEYSRRIERAKELIKSDGIILIFEKIVSLLEEDKKSATLESMDYLMTKLDRIVEILENKMREEELKKQLEDMQKKSAQLKELREKQEKLIKDTKSINKNLKEMEEFKELLEKFINTQKSLKKITDKNIEAKKNNKKIFELLNKVKKLSNKHSELSDKLIKDMTQDSKNLITMLNKLSELERKMNKTQRYMKDIKDLENKLNPNNQNNNLEKEINDLLNKANNIQKKLDDFKKGGNIPDSENVAKQLQKFAQQVANFQSKFFKYTFKTKRFNKLMETIFKSQKAFEFASQLAEENLSGETAQEFEKAKKYLEVSKKILKDLPNEIKQKSTKELSNKIGEQKKEAEQLSKYAQDYIKDNKPEKDLEKSLDDLKNVPNDLESAQKSAEDMKKMDDAQIDHETALNRVQNAISQIKKSLNNKQGDKRNDELAKEMDKLMKEAENLQNKVNKEIDEILEEHQEDEKMKDVADEAKENFNEARKGIKEQANEASIGNNEKAALKDKDVKKGLKKTEETLQNLHKMLAQVPKQKELSNAQDKLNKEFNEAMKNFDSSQNQDVKESSNKAQKAKPHMKDASENLKQNRNKNASSEQQKAIDKMQQALEKMQKKIAEGEKKISEEEKKNLEKLAEEQRKLAQMTKQFASKEKKDKQSKIKKELEEASKQMKSAFKAMRRGDQNEAKKRQDMAYKLLKKAEQKLNNSKLQYETQEALSQLEQMEVTITEVYETQKKIYEKTIESNKKKLSGSENPRQLLKDIKDIASEQEKLIPVAQFLVEGFTRQRAIVFVRIMEFVVADMQSALRQLKSSDVGSYTQSIQEDILKNLETLLGSLKFEVRKIKQRSGGGGGGRPGQQRRPPRIPPLAEIKLIKAMEVNIKLKTEKLLEESKRMFNNANEPKIRIEIWEKEFKQKLQKLMYDQDQVADLTEKIKVRLQQH